MDNTLNVRLQHAVIGEGTTVNSVPRKGEIVFNGDLNNFKVGDGSNLYGNLPFLLSTPQTYFFRVNESWSGRTIDDVLSYIVNTPAYPILDLNIYNHIVILDTSYNLEAIGEDTNRCFYSIINGPSSATNGFLAYLDRFPGKPLKVTFITKLPDNFTIDYGVGYEAASDIWLENFLIGNTSNYSYRHFQDLLYRNDYFGYERVQSNTMLFNGNYWFSNSVTITKIPDVSYYLLT